MPSRKLVILLLLCAVAAATCFGQQPAKKMTNEDVIEMLGLGLTDDVVMDKIHSTPATDFDTTVAGLKILKTAKVSDSVIRAMINPHPATPLVSARPSPGKSATASTPRKSRLPCSNASS